MEKKFNTARRTAEAVCREEITARRLIEKALGRCENLNGRLNLFVNISGNDALEQADAVDCKVKEGHRPPLAGVPLAVKDDLCYSGLPTTFGSPAFKSFISPYSAAAVEKLIEAGAVVIGKTNLDDLSMGSTTAASPFAPALNPWNTAYLAGSAGSAAVASGQCLLALESDTGGALLQGASHCGVIGLRPTMGRISRYGLNAFSSSFGQVGISAGSIEDMKLALELLSGYDQRDAVTAVCRGRSFSPEAIPVPAGIKVGWPVFALEFLESKHRSLFDRVKENLNEKGFELIDLDLSLFAEALRAYYVIAYAEASSNHSRFDGIRFGEAAYAENLDELYYKSRAVTFGREARRRSVIGTFILSNGNFDRYYRQALTVWNLVRQEFATALERCDIILLPVAKGLPRKKNEEINFLKQYEDDIFCAPVSLAGLPSICLPAGQIEGLPVGLQLVGAPFSEELLLAAGSKLAPEIKFSPDGAL